MLNLSPTKYRDVDREEHYVNSKKVNSRRPWYAPPVDPAVVLREQDYNAAAKSKLKAEQTAESRMGTGSELKADSGPKLRMGLGSNTSVGKGSESKV
ncbi:hypothetical protein EVAR_69233_1 [Eumeta japonica]|uniref:Uncharacterized protein n=1 Tax=Eumeta variegata TaxID=151549 RepID=A0A4C2A2S5_EUMVA|nr:hypothetical protein EVAR_69233_1 [Eumeta japonica]